MFRRLALTALLIPWLAVGPAAAAEEKPAASKQVGQYVDLQPVALPVVVDGRVLNYIFISVRLNLASNADTSRWRAKEPFFRDALVRAGHRSPFTLKDDYDKIDAARLTATLTREATAITGPNVIRSVVVMSQVPSRRGRPPRPS